MYISDAIFVKNQDMIYFLQQSNSAKKPKRDEKKKSQLEQFKEELKQ